MKSLRGQSRAAIELLSYGRVTVLAGVALAPVSPGIFVVAGTQGAITHAGSGRVADAGNPARALTL